MSRFKKALRIIAIIVAIIAIAIMVIFGMGYAYLEHEKQVYDSRPAFFHLEVAAFQEQIKEKVPAGMPEDEAKKVLTSLGFTLAPDRQQAFYSISSFPCLYEWHANWKTDSQSHIADINGVHTSVCP